MPIAQAATEISGEARAMRIRTAAPKAPSVMWAQRASNSSGTIRPAAKTIRTSRCPSSNVSFESARCCRNAMAIEKATTRIASANGKNPGPGNAKSPRSSNADCQTKSAPMSARTIVLATTPWRSRTLYGHMSAKRRQRSMTRLFIKRFQKWRGPSLARHCPPAMDAFTPPPLFVFLHPEVGHDLRKPRVVLRDQLGEVRRRQERGREADRLAGIRERLRCHRFLDRAFELGDDRRRRTFGDRNAPPHVERNRIALLGGRRDIREHC